MNKNLSMITDKLGNRLREYTFTITIYFRIFIPVMFPEYDKCIYIDSDTVIPGDISEFFNEELEDNYLGCIIDKSTIDNEILASFFEQVVGIPRDKYINSGVLLINLKKWRMMDIEERFLDFIELYKGEVPHHDQGVINGVCKGNIFILDPQYNVNTNCYLFNNDEIKDIYKIKNYYEKDKVEYGKNNPTILHFTPGFMNRPWVKGCKHPKRELYLKYKRETCWKNIGLEEDKRNWKIKLLSNLYYILPRKVFNTIYKLI